MNVDKILNNFEAVKMFFENFKGYITFEEIQEQFAVDVIRNIIMAKYPAYSIHILNTYISDEVLNMILEFSDVSIKIEPVIDNQKNRGYVTIISINDTDIESNMKVSEHIMKILEDNEISYERVLGTQNYPYYVDVDAKGNIVGKK